MIIHLNPRYHTRMGESDVWKRLENVPRKKRYVPKSEVVAIMAWKE